MRLPNAIEKAQQPCRAGARALPSRLFGCWLVAFSHQPEVPMILARRIALSALLLSGGVVPPPARAQAPDPNVNVINGTAATDSGSWVDRLGRRMSGSIGLLQMSPVGEFRQYVGLSYGAGGSALVRLDQGGIFALRTELGWIDYGEESKRSPLSSTISGRVQVKVKTTNQILVFGFGPQVTAPAGFIRPYTGATLGFTHFFTDSGIEGADDTADFARTTNHYTTKFAWTGNSGIYVPLHYGPTPVLLDLGVTYVGSGRLSYLRRGSIVDLPDNKIRLDKVTSETRFLAARVGVKLGR